MKAALLHPVLFAIFPILFIFSHNAKSLSINNIFIPLLIVIPLIVVLFLITAFLIRNKQKAAIFVSIIVFLVFAFGHITNALGSISVSIFGLIFGPNKIAVLVYAITLLFSFFILQRSNKTFDQLTAFLNIFAIILVGFQLILGAYILATRTQYHEPIKENRLVISKTPPDIYYIILDGYGRSDILKEIYNYDNSEFINYLKETGFYVAEQSHSNYGQTLLSMFSAFNMNYLEALGIPIDSISNDRMMLSENLWENNVIRPLAKQSGYSTVGFDSGYSLLKPQHVDVYFDKSLNLSEYHYTLLHSTPFHLLFLKMQPQYEAYRNRIIYTFEKLGNITEVNSPKFVYAHIKCPHPPFVFSREGKLMTKPDLNYIGKDGSHYFDLGGTVEKYLEGYINNLRFVTNMVKATIKKLKTSADYPFIIVLQGDHGPGSGLDWSSLENTNIRERFSILNAYYFYDKNYSLLYSKISPVNTFRVIFNQYFGANYDLLPDKSFYSTWQLPFKCTEVTNSLKSDTRIFIKNQH